MAAALLAVTVSRLLSPVPERSCLYVPCESGRGQYSIADPAAVARALNAYFPLDQTTRQYFTLLYGILDVTDLGFRYVAAGHPPPVVLRERGPEPTLEVTGPPIGMLESASYQTGFVGLRPGDRVVGYTDGVIEPEDSNGHPFGEARLRQFLAGSLERPLGEAVESLMDRVDQWASPDPLDDDASILAFEIR